MSTQLGVFLILELTCRPHQPCFIGSMGTSGVVRPYFCAPKYDVCAADLKTPPHLSAEFVKSWKEANPEGEIIVRDLSATSIPPLDAAWVGAVYTPFNCERDTCLLVANRWLTGSATRLLTVANLRA
jgi:hypothetical protein